MLVRFSVQNFRSIGEQPITLNMVSSTKEQRHADHVVNFGSAKILRDAVIYGANAAGKSNIIRALGYLVQSLRNGSLLGGYESSFCRSAENGAVEKTTFDVQFETEGIFFDYGFSCFLGTRQVTDEWLYELGSGKEKTIFSRNADELDIPFLEHLKDDAQKRIEVYTADFKVDAKLNPSRFFLATLNQGRVFDTESGLEFLSNAYDWLTRHILLFNPGSRDDSSFDFYFDNLDRAGKLLATFDTGINSLEKETITLEALRQYVPSDLMSAVHQALEMDPTVSAMTLRGGDILAGIVRPRDEEPQVTILKLKHAGSSSIFDFGDESAGTKRLFDILDMLLTHEEDTVFVIDELSRGLHPLLTKHFIDLFNEVHADDKCQLLFTTHENDIMSFDHFRKDEIWFVERSADGISTLYPLDEFIVRSDTRIGKGYMTGRYGGIPALSVLKSLNAMKSAIEDDATIELTGELES